METPVTPQEISKAQPDDYNDLVKLLDIANAYAVQRSGVPGWTAMEYVYGKIGEQIEKGEIFVLKNNQGAIVASVAFNEDGEFWGDKASDHKALYFQKLLKDPGKTQPNVGKQLIGYVAQEALARGKEYIRCDTVSELTGLIKYYENLGFRSMGNFIYDSSSRPGVLLQADAASVLEKTK